MTGQVMMIPALTTGNEATESMTDSKAVQRTMEKLNAIHFRVPRIGHAKESVGLSKCKSQRLSTWLGLC